MGLKTKKVTIGDTKYTVSEQTMRVVMPLLDGGEGVNVGVELSKMAISTDGKPLGDRVLDLGFGEFQTLLMAVNEVHGLGNA